MAKEISDRIFLICKNRGMTLEKIGNKLGMTKQGVRYVLKEREDKNWTLKDIEWWSSKLNIDKKHFEVK